MNTNKTSTKLLATITIMLLFASAMLAVVPQANAGISLATASASIGSPGDKVTITATADNPGSTIVAYWDTIAAANKMGYAILNGTATSASFEVTIPEARRGDAYAIQVVEELTSGGGSTAGSKAIPFEIVPKITLTLDQDIVGATVTIKGSGFTRSISTAINDVSFKFDGADLPIASVRPDSNGSFSTTFVVPDKTYMSSYPVVATGTQNGDTATAQFTVGPVITLSQSSGPVGTFLTIYGRGFTPSTSTVTSKVDTITIASGTISFVPVEIDGDGTFSTTATITSGSGNNRAITVKDVAGRSASRNFNFTSSSSAAVSTDLIAGQPTTNAGPGDTITITGRNFAATAGTNVTLTLKRSGSPDIFLGNATTGSDGRFTYVFTVPRINTVEYTLEAKDEYDITATCPFVVTLLYVGVYENNIPVTYDLKTGMEITIKGMGFNLFGDNAYSANVTLNGQLVGGQNLDNNAVTSTGVKAIIGVAGSTLEPGTYTVGITAYVDRLDIKGYMYAETEITVSEVADVIVTPKIAARGTEIVVNGTNFTPGSATIRILNATTGLSVRTVTGVPVYANGTFSRVIDLPANFALGDYIVNATDNSRVTAKADLKVAKVTIDIALGASTYNQGDIATFQLSSNTAPTGAISVYDSSGALVTKINLETNKWFLTNSDTYSYQQSQGGGVPAGALLQIASDARTGAWTWKAEIKDANELQTYNGTFTVNQKGATTTTPPPTQTPTPPTATPTQTPTPPTETPAPPTETDTTSDGNGGISTAMIIAIVALVVAVIAGVAIFMFRRNIAN